MNAEVGHAYVVGIRVDEGEWQPASPVFDDGALFPGKLLSGFFDFITTHKYLLTPHRLSKTVGNVILNEVKNLGREELLQALRSFRMTENHYQIV